MSFRESSWHHPHEGLGCCPGQTSYRRKEQRRVTKLIVFVLPLFQWPLVFPRKIISIKKSLSQW